MTKQLTTITDLSKDDIIHLLESASELDYQFITKGYNTHHFADKTIAMIFEKPSLRTHVAFDVAATQLGGNAIYLTSANILTNNRESLPDIAKNLGNFANIILARVFSHETVKILAQHSPIPVINGLCDLHHPTQTLADLYTIWDLYHGFPEDLKIAYVGDGCNTINSLMLACDILGIHISIATPKSYEIPDSILQQVQGGKVSVTNDPVEAVKDADIIYTDTWISMGLEHEYAQRLEVFQPYQVNAKLLAHAKKTAKVMHCLPAHRGEEITAEVIDGPQSLVFPQSKARLIIAKALLKWMA